MKTEKEIREQLLRKAEADKDFRDQLAADPRSVVEREFGVTIPAAIEMHVHEETATSVHLVLPPAGGRIGPADLQAVAGGAGGGTVDSWG